MPPSLFYHRMRRSAAALLVVVVVVAALLTTCSAAAQVSHHVRRLQARPIVGASEDCSDYQYYIRLSEELAFSYVISRPTDGRDATLSGVLQYAGEAWLGIGFSPDDATGDMVGSEAIIGLPDEPVGIFNPGKYNLISKEVSGVQLRDESDQTLTNANVVQSGGVTIMTFTKKLEEDGEIEIFGGGRGGHVVLFAHGISNELGPHVGKKSSGAFWLEDTSCIPPEFSEPTEQDDPLLAENESFACSDYEHQIEITEYLTMSYIVNVPDDGSSDGTLSVKMEYDGIGWIGFGTAGDEWGMMVGSEAIIGLPDEPQSQTNPGKYILEAEYKYGVYLMDDFQQTLTDASITQDDGKTVMTFTKKLQENYELEILGDGDNTFVWAVGTDNILGLHQASGSFKLTLSPCTVPEPTPSPTSPPSTDIGATDTEDDIVGNTTALQDNDYSPVSANTAAPQDGADSPVSAVDDSPTFTVIKTSGYSTETKRNFWRAHAYLGLFAWGICAPLAIAASWFRKLLPPGGRIWFKIHMSLNILVLVFTVASFGIAVAMYRDSNKSLFGDPHGAVGLVLTIVVTLQAGAGILRPADRARRAPPRPKAVVIPRPPPDQEEQPQETGEDSVEVDDSGQPISPNPSGITGSISDVSEQIEIVHAAELDCKPEQQYASLDDQDPELLSRLRWRKGWAVGHKMMGFILLCLGLWQVQEGISLYAAKFDTKSYSSVFWGLLGGILLVVWLLTVYLNVRDVR